jgi:hypothetical protein
MHLKHESRSQTARHCENRNLDKIGTNLQIVSLTLIDIVCDASLINRKSIQTMNESSFPKTSRRTFIKSSTAAAIGGAITGSMVLSRRGQAQTASTLKVGLVGCGGRGTGAANQALNADSNAVLTAMGDAFENKLASSLRVLQEEQREKVQVAPENRFVGLDAFQQVIDSGVDVVLLATPPGFRPQHLKTAIEAGKHVFCEKPMATDSPGIRSVMESVALAKQKNLALVAGFCWRYDSARRALYERILDGAIGEIRSIYATY